MNIEPTLLMSDPLDFPPQPTSPSPVLDGTRGFVKLLRTSTTEELIRHKNAFHLLTVIAYRARYTDQPNLEGLHFGQALIGDHDAIGMSRKEYRGACAKLRRFMLVEFKTSSKGTVATLLDSSVFDLAGARIRQKEGHLRGHRLSVTKSQNGAIERANEGPAAGHQWATNKKVRNKEREEGGSPPSSSDNWPATLPEADLQSLAASLDRKPEDLLALYEAYSARKRDFKDPAPSSMMGVIVSFKLSYKKEIAKLPTTSRFTI